MSEEAKVTVEAVESGESNASGGTWCTVEQSLMIKAPFCNRGEGRGGLMDGVLVRAPIIMIGYNGEDRRLLLWIKSREDSQYLSWWWWRRALKVIDLMEERLFIMMSPPQQYTNGGLYGFFYGDSYYPLPSTCCSGFSSSSSS